MSWACTADIRVAIGQYIGECLVRPRPIADRVHLALLGESLPAWRQFYYGEPDESLRQRFGYPPQKGAG